MIKKTALVLAATLVAGTTSMAHANEALDSTTGLRTEFFYAPLDQLEQQGAPMSSNARLYLTQNSAPRSARAGRSYSRPVENSRRGFNARAQAPGAQWQPGLGERSKPQSEFDSSGAPIGPYDFE